MRKKASILVLTGAVTMSNMGLTTFADVKDENLLTQEISTDLKNEVAITDDEALIVSEVDEQIAMTDDVSDENLLIKNVSTNLQDKVVIEQGGIVRVAGEDGQIRTADDVFITPGTNGQAPTVDQFGNVTLPTGGKVYLQNGTIVEDIGNDHSIIVPGGTVITPNGNGGAPTVNADGSVNVPEGSMVVLSVGYETTPPKGSSVSNNGDVATLSGVAIKASGTVVVPGQDGQIGTADDVLVKPLIHPDIYGEIPTIDEFGNVTLPSEGKVFLPDGTIVEDIGDDHSIIVPGGTVITPNGNGGAPTVNADGSVNVPEGSMVVLPNGDYMTPQDGSVVSLGGSIESPDGSIIRPDGSVENPGGNSGNQDGSVENPGGNGGNQNGSIENPDQNSGNQGGSVEKPTESVNNSSQSAEKQDINTENPKTGDRSIMGTVLVGLVALLALVKNMKIKDKLFIK